ncbi:MAG: ATP-dependent DNA ligase [Candidatus Woesearchaeota archaeon]
MDYSKLVEVYLELEKTSKRLEKVDIISDLLKNCGKDDLIRIVRLLQGRVFPLYDERKIGMSSRLILKVIGQSAGVSVSDVEKLWRKKGDLGDVAEELLKHKKQTTLAQRKLDVQKIFDNIRKLTEMEGEGTVNRKIGLIAELLTSARPVDARFIVRTVLDELRVGVAEGVLRDSIAKAYGFDANDVEKTFDVLVDYGEVAEKAKEGKLRKLSLEVGRPLRVMLSIKVDDVGEAFKAVGKPALCEQKIDGFRVQIHKKGKEVKLFTRRLENVTKQFKETVSVINEHVKANECILDSEFVGYDPKTKKYLPFQNISQRIKRKYNIESVAKKFPVVINVFDVLHYNGEDLVNEEQEKRRELLEKIVKERKWKFVLTDKLVTDNEKKAMKFFKESLKEGHEGLMIKNLKGVYQPGRRVSGWVKLKNVLEPLDLVIIGAEWGSGKRAGLLSSFVLGCKHGNEFLECGMLGTGIKEKSEEGVSFKELTKLLKPLVVKEEGRKVKIKPKVVIEVGYEEIQKSLTYSSGFALRFPRLLRLRFMEKSPRDTNTLEDIKKFYKQQRK